MITKTIEEELKKFAEDLEKFKNAKVKCGIIGMSGSGKSSLMNAIAGKKIAETDEVECTMEISQAFEHKGIFFHDLPGSSTEKFPKATYVNEMKISEFDCIIYVTKDRFYEDDLFLIKEIEKISIPLYIVRNQIDISVINGLKKNTTESDTLSKIRLNLENSLKDCNSKKIYLTSAEYPQRYDLNKLLFDISKKLSEFKKQRFIADIAITSTEILEEKVKIATNISAKYAALSAANGLNPIPGLDIAVDVSLLLKMIKDITDMFGLNKSSLEYISTLSNSSQLKTIVGKASQFLLKYVSTEAILIVLKRVSGTLAVKEFSKWIPMVGQVVAAGLGFKITYSLGLEIIQDSKKIAEEIFESFSNEEEKVFHL